MTSNVVELRPQLNITNDIEAFLHCKKCLEETKDTYSQELEVGWTETGLQVWCCRHDINIINIDFEGHSHPAE